MAYAVTRTKSCAAPLAARAQRLGTARCMTAKAVLSAQMRKDRPAWLQAVTPAAWRQQGRSLALLSAAAAKAAGPHGGHSTLLQLLQQRRTYLDSVDRSITVRSMADPLEVLQFMADHADSDARTFEAALRTLGKLVRPATYSDIVNDGRFHGILASLASRLDDCDARMLSMVADATARFRTSTPELSDLAQRLAEVVIRREDALNPRNLASIAIALSLRSVRDTATIEFVRTEAIKLMDDFEPTQCVLLLEAFRRWGVFDKQLVDLVVERMCDEVDRFTARDVVDALEVVSRMGLARGFLIRRLCSLSFENLRQFTPRELTKMAYALGKLRFLTHTDVDDLLDAFAPDLEKVTASALTEMLFALGMANALHQLDFARTLVEKYVGDGPFKGRTLGSLADFCWALCNLGLVDEYSQEFKAAIEEIFDRSPPQNRVPLIKLFDVLGALELEHKGLSIPVPAIWKAACDDADRFEMEKLESSRLHNEIIMRFDHLRGMANGMRWQLRMLRNQPTGPYRVDMLDEDSKIVLDVETISWPVSRRMKHEFLRGLGFKPLRIDYWEWRRARSEEDQNLFLEREVTRVLQP
mmetsp:Transcript_129369/g.258287  ORF Transcript_129369/g.258287 Transcript_129369/m.258287 type:complete len:584 (-) Transcript_129369:37-1788(-)